MVLYKIVLKDPIYYRNVKKMSERTYECQNCGKKIQAPEDENPECCGEPMKQLPLEVCTQPHEAEYSGPFEEDEPCDDGR